MTPNQPFYFSYLKTQMDRINMSFEMVVQVREARSLLDTTIKEKTSMEEELALLQLKVNQWLVSEL